MLLCLLALHHLTPVSAGVVYTFATVPSLLIVLWQVRHLVGNRWRLDIASFRLLLSYGVRSYGVDILGALALQLDQVLVIRMLAPAAMGIYGVTLSLSRIVCLFQVSVASVLFPQASGRTVDEILNMTEYSTRVSTLITGACALAAASVGPFLLRALYGREYSGASLTLDILLVEITLSGAVYVLSRPTWQWAARVGDHHASDRSFAEHSHDASAHSPLGNQRSRSGAHHVNRCALPLCLLRFQFYPQASPA